MSLVGKKAPFVSAPAVINGEEIVESFSLDQYIGNKYVVLFFYPKDFSFICPTEITAFQDKIGEFEERHAAVVGCSCDTEETHLAWMMVPQEHGGIEGVRYPIIADSAKVIAQKYQILAGEYDYDEEGELYFDGTPVAYRATFLIDKKGIIRHETVNDLPLDRNIDEMIRLVDALRYVEQHGEACSANWEESKNAMKVTKMGVANYLAKNKIG